MWDYENKKQAEYFSLFFKKEAKKLSFFYSFSSIRRNSFNCSRFFCWKVRCVDNLRSCSY